MMITISDFEIAVITITKITKIHVLDIVKEAVVGVQELLEPSGALLRNNIDVVMLGLVVRTNINVDGIIFVFTIIFRYFHTR